MGHNEKPENFNLGFGFLYYGVVRALQPSHVLVIGSGYGFSVVCLALGLKDNGKGRLSFVDPSYDVLKHGPFKTVGGRGKWNDPREVIRHFGHFDVNQVVTHYKMRSDEFFPQYRTLGLPRIDLAFIDGNHSYEHVKFDFVEALGHMRKNSYVFLHDTNIYIREMLRNSGVKRWLKLLKREKELFEIIDFPFSSGVALMRILQDDAWKYFIPSCLQ
jgi:predicted O-methyltransferase YrrM